MPCTNQSRSIGRTRLVERRGSFDGSDEGMQDRGRFWRIQLLCWPYNVSANSWRAPRAQRTILHPREVEQSVNEQGPVRHDRPRPEQIRPYLVGVRPAPAIEVCERRLLRRLLAGRTSLWLHPEPTLRLFLGRGRRELSSRGRRLVELGPRASGQRRATRRSNDR